MLNQQFEVELKFRLTSSIGVMGQRLSALGAVHRRSDNQADHYFNHPSRDFKQTDEAFRIRTVGKRNWLTWKGPKLGSGPKTRREIELPLGDGPQTAGQLEELLTLLGFRPVAIVRKTRRNWKLTRDGRSFSIAIDEVEQVGLFLEIELLAASDELDAARQAVEQLAAELETSQPVRRSYLALLLGEDEPGA